MIFSTKAQTGFLTSCSHLGTLPGKKLNSTKAQTGFLTSCSHLGTLPGKKLN